MNDVSSYFDALERAAERHQVAYPEGFFPSDADISKMRQLIVESITRGPVLRQYVSHLDRGLSGQFPKNVFPWHAEGERQYAASLFAAVGTGSGARLVSSMGAELGDVMAVSFGVATLTAAVYLWSDEIETLAVASPLPSHVISRDALPMPVMFWSRETAYVAPDGSETNWMLVMHSVGGIRMVIDLARSPTVYDLVVADIPYGSRYPDDFPDDDRQLSGVTSVLGRLAFLSSPYVSKDTAKLPRAWRREMASSKILAPMADPSIHVVQLRREVRETIERQRQDLAHPTERRSHWWVSGHNRAQWYPSEEAHHVIWIAPHLKGNLAGPLIRKVYTVVR